MGRIEKIQKHWRKELEQLWAEDWNNGLSRNHSIDDVIKFRGQVKPGHYLADVGARKFRALIENHQVNALSAITGMQAVQNVKAGLEAIYLSGWQVAADANSSLAPFPDQSIYPVDSVPVLAKRINNALHRHSQIDAVDGMYDTDWMVPLVADMEAGFGGLPNTYQLTLEMLNAGVAAVHLEDQLSSEKKCGHMGGKVLVPTNEAVAKLRAARLAADVAGVPTVIIARTDANSAKMITSDADEHDRQFIDYSVAPTEVGGFRRFKNGEGGLEVAIDRCKSYAPYADLLWVETSNADLEEARTFMRAVREDFPDQKFAYNCSPSFNWRENVDNPKKTLTESDVANFHQELAKEGCVYTFITLSAFHAMNLAQFELASDYKERGMTAYMELQEREYATPGYTAARHQREAGTGYFDAVTNAITAGKSATTALAGSTEEEQFVG